MKHEVTKEPVTNIPIRRAVLKEARIATGITGQTLTEFVSDAVARAATPIVRREVMERYRKSSPVADGVAA